jgi:hypothetical protein
VNGVGEKGGTTPPVTSSYLLFFAGVFFAGVLVFGLQAMATV